MGTENTTIFTPLVTAIISTQGATMVMLLAALITMAWRVGRTPTHNDMREISNDLKTEIGELRAETRQEIGELRAAMRQEIGELRAAMRQEIGELRTEMQQEIAEFRTEVRQEIGELRTEMQQGNALLLQEIRRSHQQLMLALVNHTHNADGQAVFTLPPELEPTPAND